MQLALEIAASINVTWRHAPYHRCFRAHARPHRPARHARKRTPCTWGTHECARARACAHRCAHVRGTRHTARTELPPSDCCSHNYIGHNYRGHDYTHRVATERLLQHARKLGVAVRNERLGSCDACRGFARADVRACAHASMPRSGVPLVGKSLWEPLLICHN